VRRPPGSPPFPYTTLFRSAGGWWLLDVADGGDDVTREGSTQSGRTGASAGRSAGNAMRVSDRGSRDVNAAELVAEGQSAGARERSEEHTSELQSRENLVCR